MSRALPWRLRNGNSRGPCHVRPHLPSSMIHQNSPAAARGDDTVLVHPARVFDDLVYLLRRGYIQQCQRNASSGSVTLARPKRPASRPGPAPPRTNFLCRSASRRAFGPPRFAPPPELAISFGLKTLTWRYSEMGVAATHAVVCRRTAGSS